MTNGSLSELIWFKLRGLGRRVSLLRGENAKRGCEFLGLRILENIRRDWLTVAPD
jgi:hypothetical protein